AVREPLARGLTGALPLALAVAMVAAFPAASDAQSGDQARSGGNGLIYVGTYEPSIHVIDEATMNVVDKIEMKGGIPGTLTPSRDGTRIFAQIIDYEQVEIVDLETRQSVDVFTLSERNTRARIRGMAVHPNGRHAVLMF